MAAVEKNNVKFDDTYVDIINSAKVDISVGRNAAERDRRLKRIEEIIDGTVTYDTKKDEFYLKKGQSKQEFNLVAEGIRKMALLWQLVKKYYDSLHYLALIGKNKPKEYIYILEYPGGDSVTRKAVRNIIKKKLPFKLQSELSDKVRLIDKIEVLSIKEWNEHEEYGNFPIKPVKLP